MKKNQNHPISGRTLFAVVLALAAVALLGFHLMGADVSPGYSFTTGESVTASKFNQATAGSINTTFLTDKSADTAPNSSDLLLTYDVSGGVYKKATIGNTVLNNADLINTRSAVTVSHADEVLLYDTSGSAYGKATASNLVYRAQWENFSGRARTNLATTAVFMLNDEFETTNRFISAVNLFKHSWLSGLKIGDIPPLETALAAGQEIPIFTAASTNATVTMTNLLSGWTRETTDVVDADVVTYYDTSAEANKTVSLSDLRQALFPAGSVLQTVQGTLTATNGNFTDATWTDSGLTVDITPAASANKVLVRVALSAVCSGGSAHARLVRDSTAIGVGDDDSANRVEASFPIARDDGSSESMGSAHFEWLDSPSTTSATTYKVQVYQDAGTGIFINRNAGDSDADSNGRYASTITVQEIKQ